MARIIAGKSRRPGGSPGRGFSKSGRRISSLAESTKKKINLVIRRAALEIMNGIAEAGPNWSGEFRGSYVCTAIGTGAKQASSGSYPYTLKNIPQLSTTVRELSRFNRLEIGNQADHAEIAMDMQPAVFETTTSPEGPIVGRGFRPVSPHLRPDLNPVRTEDHPKPGRITAPVDWLPNYLKGGGLQENLSAGVRIALRER